MNREDIARRIHELESRAAESHRNALESAARHQSREAALHRAVAITVAQMTYVTQSYLLAGIGSTETI